MPVVRYVLVAAALVAGSRISLAQRDTPATRAIDTVRFAPALGVDISRSTSVGVAYIRDLTTGTGRRATRGDVVSIRMEAWRADGVLLSADSTRPFIFQIGGGVAVRGIDKGVVGMLEGGRRQIIIPGQTESGSAIPGVSPDAPVVFVVELLHAHGTDAATAAAEPPRTR